MQRELSFALVLLGFFAGCSKSEQLPAPKPGTPAAPSAPGSVAPPGAASEPLRPRTDLPADQRALIVLDGKEQWVEPNAAIQAGYTIVDLSDDWTPLIFREEHDPNGVPLPNRYRRVFVGLANDQLDNDGAPLEPGRKNYLELYGIFPSLSVLRARFLHDAEHPCSDPESVEVLSAVETVSYVAPQNIAKDEKKLRRTEAEVEAARKAAKLSTLDELSAQKPDLAPKVAFVQKRAAEKRAMAAVEKRLRCEGLLTDQSRHVAGVYDEPMRQAVRQFQHKNMIYEANFLRRRTVDALAAEPLQNDYEGLVRTLRERVVSAAGIIEDGTAVSKKVAVPDLVTEYTQQTLNQLGLSDAPSALAFFKRHDAAQFKKLWAAVKLPPRPAYYSEHMELSIEVDRGDVWYDLPFDASGNFTNFPRKRFPSLTLLVTHQGQSFPLARWRTTIGGWRSEQVADGYEYFRYKASDVGPRVIRQIISGPVWIAPPSTPIRTLVKQKMVNGGAAKVVNYDELGPGYTSAYGVVAGYFVIPGQNGRPDYDNGVRAHGSSDYLSIYSAGGYSHGCHRLPNHIAVRLYSFILAHRHKVVAGDQPLNFSRQFLQGETVYEMRIPSRGFAYYLDPPLPVNVSEGTIRGQQKTPIAGYVPKPGVIYPGPPPAAPDSPEEKAGGSGEE